MNRNKYFYDEFKSVDKKTLVNLVKNKNKSIEYDHIDSIISLFLVQLEEDLFKKKSIDINNFIEFNLRRMPAKRGRNYYTGEIVPTKAFNIMKVSLNSKLNKKLMSYCNVEAYYSDSNDPNLKKDKQEDK